MIIDFHSHMLPGIDDGSPDLETSLAMLRESAAQGVDTVFLTPHYYAHRESIESFSQRRRKSVELLASGMEEGLPELFVGAEVRYFPNICHSDLRSLCLNGSKVLLLEMPFTQWTGEEFEDISTLSLDLGYHIVFAHVERYVHIPGNMEQLKRMRTLPISMQVNAENFTGFFPNRSAKKLIDSGMVTILASDSHNMSTRVPNLEKGRRGISRWLGPKVLECFDASAEALLEEIK